MSHAEIIFVYIYLNHGLTDLHNISLYTFLYMYLSQLNAIYSTGCQFIGVYMNLCVLRNCIADIETNSVEQ